MLESSPLQDNRDTIIDVTLFSEIILVKKGIEKLKCSLFIAYFHGVLPLKTTFAKIIIKNYETNFQVVSTNVHFVDGDVSCKSDEISLVNRAKLEIEITIDTFCIIDTFCSSITSIMKY